VVAGPSSGCRAIAASRSVASAAAVMAASMGEPGGPAGAAGMRAGDVILSAIVKGSQVEVKSPAQFNDLLQGLEKTGSMTLLVRRGDAQTFITIKGASDK